MGGHSAAFRSPIDERAAKLAPLQSTWRIVHIFSPECGCSKILTGRLLERGPSTDASELVVMAGKDEGLESSLAQRGFDVKVVDPETLADEFDVAGVPWMIVLDPKGEVAYSGGYADRPIDDRTIARDLEVLSKAKEGKAPRALASFGCAVSERYKKLSDPFGFKSSRR